MNFQNLFAMTSAIILISAVSIAVFGMIKSNYLECPDLPPPAYHIEEYEFIESINELLDKSRKNYCKGRSY